jgi:ketosteroid isomerase-like protein
LKSLPFAFCLLLSFTATTAVAQDSASARAAIEQLMMNYHQAVASHDGERLSSMFAPEGSTWFNVLTDAAYARARAKNPAAPKVRHSSFRDFAKFVRSSHVTLNPQHSNVRIFTDGTIATVYFNFVFLVDGKPENHGSETWQLVKASDGWKIAAITYSSNPSTPGH